MHEGEAGVGDERPSSDEPPGDDQRLSAPGRGAVIYGGALVGGFLVFLAGCILVTPVVGVAGWIAFAAVVIWQGRQGPRRRRGRASR